MTNSYYKKTKKSFQKKLLKDIKTFLKKEKTESVNMLLSDKKKKTKSINTVVNNISIS